jgi:glycosyltransferase involved in cell wall biosynthesis
MSLSIISTVLNNEEFIYDCLRSVKDQRISKNFEHIIVDGGSTDNTIEIIKNFKKKNYNLKLFKKKNIGIYQGINFGIKKAKHKYIGLLHSDDFYKNKNVLRNVLNIFKENPHFSAIYSNVEIVRRDNKKKILRFFKSKQLNNIDFLKCEHPPHTSLFIDRKLFITFGLFSEKLKIASDFELMLRIFGKNKIVPKYINKTFVVMRSGGTSTKNLKNIIFSNYEVYKSFKINKISLNPMYIIIKLIKKIFQFNFF